jgi:ergothioneine biosynthesis protein EgtB
MLFTENAAQPSLLTRLAEARARTDELFDIVQPHALYERPIPERHRIIFYIGHLEAFDWNLMRERWFRVKAFDEVLDRLFAFGIDPVGGGLPTDQPRDWPRLAEVQEYVREVRERIDGEAGAWQAEGRKDGGGFPAEMLMHVAIEHRLMHAETLAYMLHQLPLNQKVSKKGPRALAPERVEKREIEIPAGSATLGRRRDDTGFGWDNEYEENVVEVPAFAIDQYKITNAQYLQFLEAGGYENRDCWSDEDWKWKAEQGIRHPVFWTRRSDGWNYRTMFEEIALPLEWPVYVSQAEANAFARWSGKTLPSEAQWHRAAYGTLQGTENLYPWGDDEPDNRRGNFDFASWDPAPVNAHPAGRSAFGVEDMLGNGWEWTSTRFGPFPGFERFSFYPGYSADFFDGKHYVMKGGSARTAACMLRRSFRNWFQAHYGYVYAGFRCVRGA